ncbi:MAG TPA: hypothetical protein VGE29_06400 [Prosthecobacter sp.]
MQASCVTVLLTLLSLYLAPLPLCAQTKTLSRSDVLGWLKTQELLDEKKERDWSSKTFFDLMEYKERYTLEEIKTYQESKAAPVFKQPQSSPPLTTTTPDFEPPARRSSIASGLKPVYPRIRENFDDVLALEDPSLEISSTKDASDFNGASFSFTRDLISHEDTLQGKGSALLPFIWQRDVTPGYGWDIYSFGFIPSVSLENFVTEGTSAAALKKETDSLVYRLGGFINLGDSSPDHVEKYVLEHRLRGFLTYGTDLDHDVAIPAAELEWEPRIDLKGNLSLGHWRAIDFREGYESTDGTFKRQDHVRLAYQWRFFVKGQYGSVEDSHVADTPHLTPGSFARLGAVTELKFDPFYLPRLAFSARYQYLAALAGPDSNPDRLDISLAWTLWENEDEGRRVGLKASYINGPADLRERKVETLLLSLAITF